MTGAAWAHLNPNDYWIRLTYSETVWSPPIDMQVVP